MMIADNLKRARINAGYSQDTVASTLHISRQAVSKWENGKTYPDLDNLVELSRFYGFPIDILLRGDAECGGEMYSEFLIGKVQQERKGRTIFRKRFLGLGKSLTYFH